MVLYRDCVAVVVLPGRQFDGQVVHSLKGVTMQSFLQGNEQGRTVSGRDVSEHLLVMTGPTFIFVQLTLRLWTPTPQGEVPFQSLVPFRPGYGSSVQGPHTDASQ